MNLEEIGEDIFKKIYPEGKFGNYVCVRGMLFEENKKGDIVPIGKLYKNNTHYHLIKTFSVVIKFKRKNLEIISNQIIPEEPSSIIKAYKNDAITTRELTEEFFS